MTCKKRRIVGILFPKLLLEELDTVRGDIPRRYIARFLEKDLTSMENET